MGSDNTAFADRGKKSEQSLNPAKAENEGARGQVEECEDSSDKLAQQ